MAPPWSPSPLLSLPTHRHTEGAHGKRDSGGMRPPHNTTMWWLVGVAHDQPKSLMTAKCHHQHTHKVVEPHNTQKHHTAMPICYQAHTNAKAVECQASAISPTLASTNPTTTPSTTNNKQEGTRKKEEGRVVAQSNKCTRPQKASQHNGHLVGSIGVEQVPPVMVTTTTHHHPQPQPMRVVLEETP